MSSGSPPETINIALDRPDLYDKYVHGEPGVRSLAQAGPVSVVTKHKVTTKGNSGAVVTFLVVLPDGTHARAQAVVTMKLLLASLKVLDARYTDEGIPRLAQ